MKSSDVTPGRIRGKKPSSLRSIARKSCPDVDGYKCRTVIDLTHDFEVREYVERVDVINEVIIDELYNDELLNEPMKNLDNVDFVDTEIIHSKRLVSVHQGIVTKPSTSVGPSMTNPLIVKEKRAKIRKVYHVIDLTDDFKTTEYEEESFNVVEVVDLSN
jgi:hypothetical protein